MRNYGDTNPAISAADPGRALVNREDFSGLSLQVLGMISELYPVNSIKMWYDNDDHSGFLGLTWERCLEGRFPVGINPLETEFTSTGQQGGEKTHALTTAEAPPLHTRDLVAANGGSNGRIEKYDGASGQPHNNLPPYEVVSFWRRKK